MTFSLIPACPALGKSWKDKLTLGLFGLIAPHQDQSQKRWWRLLSRLIPKMWLKPSKLNGLQLLIDPTNWSQTVIFEEVFVRSGYDLQKVSFTPQMIFDCGGHIGIFTLLAKSAFPEAQTTVYEPNPENIRFIRRQISRNHLDVSLVEAAISIEAREMFFAASNSHNGALLHDPKNRGGYKVKVIDFPQVLQKAAPASLLLKMDIEGEERRVLPLIVPLLPRQTALFFETHAGEAGWQEMKTLLVANGFQVEIINSRGQFYDGFASRE